ncbi:MAG: hypothetical protein SGARI_000171 [Bacillariaceae sp.]
MRHAWEHHEEDGDEKAEATTTTTGNNQAEAAGSDANATTASPSSSSRFRLACYEPHLVSWWNVVVNNTANVFWVLNGTYNLFPQIASSSDTAARVTYAGAVLGGFFLIVTNYLSFVEAINNTSCDVRIGGGNHRDDDDKKHRRHRRRRFFRRPRKLYGRFTSPIGYNNDNHQDDKFRRRLMEAGFPYIENEEGHLVTTCDYDRAVAVPVALERGERSSATVASGDEDAAEKGNAGGISNSTSTATTVPLIGKTVSIVDDNFCTTTKIVAITQNSESVLSKLSYQWWASCSSTPFEYVGVLTSYVGVWCGILYFIPMCASYPWSLRNDVGEGTTLGLTHTFYAVMAHLSVAEAAGSWWKPVPQRIGWYVAWCNVVGSWGFALCGYFLIPATVGATCCQELATAGSAWACFLGACSYFVGGIIQMIEFANPDPIVLCGKKRSLD